MDSNILWLLIGVCLGTLLGAAAHIEYIAVKREDEWREKYRRDWLE